MHKKIHTHSPASRVSECILKMKDYFLLPSNIPNCKPYLKILHVKQSALAMSKLENSLAQHKQVNISKHAVLRLLYLHYIKSVDFVQISSLPTM